MDLDRRRFLQFGLAAASAASPFPAEAGQSPGQEPAPTGPADDPDHVGVLNDTTLCIGCRECEAACNRRNHLPRTATPFSDRDVLRTFRRPSETAFTVVNQFPGSPSPDQAALAQTYCKVQCMHCLYPSCVSACIVGAMTKAPDGAVVYNPTICIGCRYCQVACPFEVPAYEFHEPLAPRVRKCELCTDRAKGTGANPACAAACPTEALVFGRRADLVAMAEGTDRPPAGPLREPHLRRARGGRHVVAVPDGPAREEVGLLTLPDDAAAAADRGHPARHLPVRRHPDRASTGCWPGSCGSTTASTRTTSPAWARRGAAGHRGAGRGGAAMTALHDDRPHRVTKPFFTFGTLTLLIAMGVGSPSASPACSLGLGPVTNLDNHNPWGIWISFDVACGVALAAGGFTTAALVDIFGRRKYHALLRPAILTALLGYLWVAIALSFDLGRYWNIWRPIFNWQGNSVLFEVGHVRHGLPHRADDRNEPVDPRGAEGADRRGRVGRRAAAARRAAADGAATRRSASSLPLFIVAGVVLSCMHQSSLGTLMLIAPTKTEPAVVHADAAAAVPPVGDHGRLPDGDPRVDLREHQLRPRPGDGAADAAGAASSPGSSAPTASLKFGDLAFRLDELDFLAHPAATTSLVVEILVGVVAPFLLLLNKAVRRSVGWLFFAGRARDLRRGAEPHQRVPRRLRPAVRRRRPYFPSVGEIAMTIAIVSSILFCYRFFVTFFPILPGYQPRAPRNWSACARSGPGP